MSVPGKPFNMCTEYRMMFRITGLRICQKDQVPAVLFVIHMDIQSFQHMLDVCVPEDPVMDSFAFLINHIGSRFFQCGSD